MKGKYEVVIYDSKIKYHLILERNITIIKGKSGTGKSTLYQMFSDLVRLSKRESGISCNCKDKIMVLREDSNWKDTLVSTSDKIFIADEYIEYVQTKEFANIAQKSGNYFVIITRSSRMQWLSYSVNSIYELETLEEGDIFCTRLVNRYLYSKETILPDLIITGDSNSGYEIINKITRCDVKSAKGRDNVYNEVINNINKYKCIYIIVDGAAFGSCVGRLFPRFESANIHIFTPESFEFLLLNSKTFKRYLTTELAETYNFCDAKEFVTWERYFTKLLNKLCKEQYKFAYSKSKLNKFFKSKYFESVIKNQLEDLDEKIFN